MKSRNNMRKKRREAIKLKTIAAFQIISLIVEIFAFSFILGGMLVVNSPAAKAATSVPDLSIPKGCCIEELNGGICQNMNNADARSCKTGLIATDCNLVDNCKIGCCYDNEEGICSLNSPKEKCEKTGGNWSSDARCNIQECVLGCCILGDQAAITTTRECGKISRELSLPKNFQALDSDGTCNSKAGLAEKGACVVSSGDFSGENDCKLTAKANCKNGEFYKGVLCTAKELKTICNPAKNTTCGEDDKIYYLDTCGNIANVYDSSKFNDKSYWERIIAHSKSCSPASASCGNCDYIDGSRCYPYRVGKDTKPVYGNNVCRDLNCENGKKHGESWCLSDYENTNVFASAPVGSRWFKGICLDGQITVEPCMDFNNEICISNLASGASGFSEAKCVVNQWRSCIAANQKESYNEVKAECDKYPDDCIMFFDIPGNEKYAGLPGFKKDAVNTAQGNAGDIGKDMNKVIPWCVPKNSPGMVFWNTMPQSQASAGSAQQASQALSYGGSAEETAAICALGSFTCIAQLHKNRAGGDWKWQYNGECGQSSGDSNQEADSNNRPVLTPEIRKKLGEAFEERCRSIGPCSANVNVAGELGNNTFDNFKMAYVDENGKEYPAVDAPDYYASQSYIEAVKSKAKVIKPGTIGSLASAIFLSLMTGKATDEASSAAQRAASQTRQPMEPWQAATGAIGLGGTALYAAAQTGLGYYGLSIAAAAIAGYFVGQLLGKALGLDAPKTQALSYALGAGAATAVAMSTTTIAGTTGTSSALFGTTPILGICWPCAIIVVIVVVLTYLFTYKEDRFYVMSYSCEPWSPPKTGDCKKCNDDIRPCSKYRCKSLGQNCQYFNENGEPGYCTDTHDIWSAVIKPWLKALTPGNKYTEVTETHFKITGTGENGKIPAGESLQFGIITDKPALCKIDSKHTASYDAMAVTMTVDNTACETGTCAGGTSGLYHKVALSPSLGGNASGESTLSLVKNSENNYYIRCKNYAGLVNEAEFAVKVIADNGEDLTPPAITSIEPASGVYAARGVDSKDITLWVNEPAECRYAQGANVRFEEMTGKLACANAEELARLGSWPCYARLSNFTAGENKFYFQCADKMNLPAGSPERRNINRLSAEYIINSCSVGLNITSVSPQNKIITGKSPVEISIGAETSGCVEDGRAVCSYKGFGNSGYIPFLDTNAKIHSQVFTDTPAGNHTIGIKCEDEAGNTAESQLKINIELDDVSPAITRAYAVEQKLNIITDQIAECRYTNDESLGCSFDFDSGNSTIMEGNGIGHSAPWLINQNYFIKCADVYKNTNLGCGFIVNAWY